MRLINLLLGLVMLVNLLGGIVSGIWLAMLGEWAALGIGIVSIVGASTLIRLALLPNSFLVAMATYSLDSVKTRRAICFEVLGSIYTLCVATVWCLSVLLLFAEGATNASIIPLLLWSYGVATSPWVWMAHTARGQVSEFGSTLAAFLIQLAYIVIIVLILSMDITFLSSVAVFGGFMALTLGLQLTAVGLIQRERVAVRENSERSFCAR